MERVGGVQGVVEIRRVLGVEVKAVGWLHASCCVTYPSYTSMDSPYSHDEDLAISHEDLFKHDLGQARGSQKVGRRKDLLSNWPLVITEEPRPLLDQICYNTCAFVGHLSMSEEGVGVSEYQSAIGECSLY